MAKIKGFRVKNFKSLKAEAERGCQLYERGVSHMLSARCVQFDQGLASGVCLRSGYLFACTKD